MCYLPIPCLKFIIGVGSFISVLVSLGLLGLTVYANLQNKQIVDNVSNKVITDYLVGLYLASTIFMILGICGFYSAIKNRKKKKQGCLFYVYGFGVCLFLFVFIGATIFFMIGPKTIFSGSCSHGSHLDLVEQVYNLNNKAIANFCVKQFPCFVNETQDGADEFKAFASQNNLEITLLNTTAINYQSYLPEQQMNDPNILLMEALEKVFGCSGWCEEERIKINRFSDINQCLSDECRKKRQACYTKFDNFLTEQGLVVGIGCGAAGLLCFLNLIAVCCIQCHPTKSKKSNFYDKMHDQD